MNTAATTYDGINKYIRITDIDEDSHQIILSDIKSPLNNADDSYLLKDGDILFARTGASVGKTFIYTSDIGKAYFAGFLICQRTKKEYNPRYIFQQTLTKSYLKFVKIYSQRSGQPGINSNEYGQFVFSIPTTKREQDAISFFLSHMDSLIAANERPDKNKHLWSCLPTEAHLRKNILTK
ncbi:restriction modification system DNA specificity domain [Levilactobacillus senmaizukei DSM 21775 = NBRC 103853]|uniref:Restriction modification system DNA specificity domain n=1 Tax=Levilactobacillus senmaizukei DSM 21775 = NBRC 103853 TaxID=1423803 RepID=A0A0R2DE84_9LACO|nr:restriction endonuclease subunit S [Levilactobacillus senmaizukei]KRN02242.1 restriction modification system DNA specificity domain [Levilactobacillus senmaizukei DSM 21775 = NBRC 103853]